MRNFFLTARALILTAVAAVAFTLGGILPAGAATHPKYPVHLRHPVYSVAVSNSGAVLTTPDALARGTVLHQYGLGTGTYVVLGEFPRPDGTYTLFLSPALPAYDNGQNADFRV